MILRRRPRLGANRIPPVVPSRPDLTVAVVLDPFSELAFGYEWSQVTFGPDDWRATLEARRPDLLFVESAWNGNDGRWRLHMTRDDRPSPELQALVAWCRERGVPTVFWNKEDPPNYAKFLETARLFDHVFTVDADRIPVYQRDLGHDRIALLPFAAQQRLHRPVRWMPGRPYEVAFAGTWFAEKHPERRAQMEYVLGPAVEHGLHIWSRMQRGDKRYRFPKPYRSHVVGSLPYRKMIGAYTAYKVFLNVNSVTGSRTMCSRRLFELSAAQTAIVSAPAASIEPFFGDTVTVVQDAAQTEAALTRLLGDDDARDRQALRAHRRVFDEHLYSHRVDTVLTTVGLAGGPRPAPRVSAVVPTRRPEQLDHVLETIARQSHPDVELVLVTHGFAPDEAELQARAAAAGVQRLVLVPADGALSLGRILNLGTEASTGELVGKMDDDNFYGTHYLTDLVRALDFSGADVVGKWAHLVRLEGTGETLLRFAHAEHRYVKQVQGGTLLTRRDVAERIPYDDLPRGVDTAFLNRVAEAGLTVYSADRFNFVSIRSHDPSTHTWSISDDEIRQRSSQVLDVPDPYALAEV
ncbi:glycosyltransferase [Nocardioides sp. TRM66260-LWL]|uniref:glycosyltransferase family protein n=1 Tax=Nocardioides sp. TRM66260-LWL TaxID=2874478 RepID=UPI001CC7F4CE|nr:glycosyltransferase [Nocardioides sp. TRM66260-LWL]MBZ5735509.1 glycosyltransferase [Nocardioides sp. TRM66260-LWL]